MFALKSHRLGKTKKQTDVPRMTDPNPEHEIDDTIKTRFQEIGPQFTLKMRWIRRGPLGETGDERTAREKFEAETGEQAAEFGKRAPAGAAATADGDDDEMDEDGMDVDGEVEVGGASDEEADDAEAEEEARRAIGLDESDAAGQPNFSSASTSANAEASTSASTSTAPAADDADPDAPTSNPKKRPRTTPRIRKKPYHALLNPPPSDSPSPEPEEVPLPTIGKKKNPEFQSAIDTVGKTWHAGKGEGGVREGAKRREWNWEVRRAPFPVLLESSWLTSLPLSPRAGQDAGLAAQVLPLSLAHPSLHLLSPPRTLYPCRSLSALHTSFLSQRVGELAGPSRSSPWLFRSRSASLCICSGRRRSAFTERKRGRSGIESAGCEEESKRSTGLQASGAPGLARTACQE